MFRKKDRLLNSQSSLPPLSFPARRMARPSAAHISESATASELPLDVVSGPGPEADLQALLSTPTRLSVPTVPNAPQRPRAHADADVRGANVRRRLEFANQ